jgi:predicted GIY-YIG superfamily endonuclease
MVRPACRQAGRLPVMEYYVYVIKSRSKAKFYTGMTSDFERRLKEHKQRLSSTRTTKSITDFEPIFVQVVKSRKIARRLEKYLKSGFGREIRGEIVKYVK